MTTFDRTTAVEPDGTGAFRAELDTSWSSLRGIHGGYVASIAVRAVEATMARAGQLGSEQHDTHVRTASVAFLRPAKVGPVRVVVDTVRAGRKVSAYGVQVEQDGRAIAVARVTTTVAIDGVDWETDPMKLPAPVAMCVPIAPPERVRHFDQAHALLDPSGIPFSRGPRAHLAGWVRPLETRPIDAPWLTMILDWFPPAAFVRTEPPVGGVSVDFTVHIHRTLPALGDGSWIAGVFRNDTSASGLSLEHGVLADGSGRLLAESFHTRLAA